MGKKTDKCINCDYVWEGGQMPACTQGREHTFLPYSSADENQDYKALFEQQVKITDRLIKVLGFYASEETYIYAECKDMGYEARKILSGK